MCMPVFLIAIGVVSLIYGLLKITGLKREDTSKDTEFDKKALSEKSRYFLGRYYAGIQGIIGGMGLIVLGLILYLS